LEDTTEKKEEGSALPLPRKGEASASPEKKEGKQGEVVSFPELSAEEKHRRIAACEDLKRKLNNRR
jgi:hypothetical protein